MKKILVLVVALVMLAGIGSVSAADKDNKLGLGFQGILMGETIGGVSVRGWSDQVGFDVAIFEAGVKIEPDGASDETAELVILQAGGMIAPEDWAGKYAKFYVGGNLGYAMMDADDMGYKGDAWLIEPLCGFEYNFAELPEIGFNCQVGYAYVMGSDDDDTMDVTLRGINATAGVHYYFP